MSDTDRDVEAFFQVLREHPAPPLVAPLARRERAYRWRIIIPAAVLLLVGAAVAVAAVGGVIGRFHSARIYQAATKVSYSVALEVGPSSTSNIVLLDTKTGTAQPLIHRIGSQTSPAWSPNGRTLYFTSTATPDSPSAIYRASATGHSVMRLTAPWISAHDPIPSPDGRWVAFVGKATPHPSYRSPESVWIMRPDGTGPHVVVAPPSGSADVVLFGWSASSQQIATAALFPPNGEYSPYITSLAGRSRKIGSPPRVESWAAWSPAGGTIALVSQGGLYVIASASSRVLLHIHEKGANYSWPTWSPDGRLLAVRATFEAKKYSALQVISIADGRVTTLRRSSSPFAPTWLPADRGLLFWRSSVVRGQVRSRLWAVDLEDHVQLLVDRWPGSVPESPLAIRPTPRTRP